MLSHRHRSCGILCLCDVKDGKLIIEENTTNMVNIKVIDSTWVPQIGEYKKSIIVYSDNWNDYGYYTLFHMIYFDEQGFIKQIGSLKIYSKALDELKRKIFGTSSEKTRRPDPEEGIQEEETVTVVKEHTRTRRKKSVRADLYEALPIKEISCDVPPEERICPEVTVEKMSLYRKKQ